MKWIFTLSIVFSITYISFSQIDFGSDGSFWLYTYHPHNGVGGGWDMISIEGDTMVNNQLQKIVRRTYRYSDGIPSTISQGSSIIGTMLVSNDSVFINDKLILNFTLELNDSMDVDYWEYVDYFSQLVVDSITLENINGLELSKWHGKKICHSPSDTFEYETYEIIEDIGQIGNEYLLWNIDGCITGGGSKYFDCYKNGDFIYPPNFDCEMKILTSNFEILNPSKIKLGPNPTLGFVNIESDTKIKSIMIFDLSNKLIQKEVINEKKRELNIRELNAGIYIIQIELNDSSIYIDKLVKMKG